MSDLVERLRYTASIRERHRLDSDNDPIRLECLEAADRIEQLEAALREIGNPPNHFTINDAVAVARAALEDK